jgi:hypothetical protein
MVLGGPRSATTWAANWLTTDTTVCLHDPLLEYKIEYLQRMSFDGKKFGISCTSSTLYPDWVNKQKCPKVVLTRDVHEINNSLRELGLVELIPAKHMARLAAIKDALFVPYEWLFHPSKAAFIAQHLGVPFDITRHDVLMQMRVEPMWRRLNIGRDAAKQLIKRITEAR